MRPLCAEIGLRARRGICCVLALAALFSAIVTPGQTQASPDSATLQGVVRDSAGRIVPGATVYLQLKDGVQSSSTAADAEGRYRFSGLRDGTYVLRTENKGHSSTTFGPCVIAAGEAKTLDLTMGASAAGSSSKPTTGQTPEFFDEPQFTVAGVTDGTNLGGHGSNTIVRAKDALAKDIASLSASANKDPYGKPAGKSVSSASPEAPLRAALARQPESYDANHRLGKLLVDNGKASEGIAYLERASKLKPGDDQDAYLLAMAYADTAQFDRARSTARALLIEQVADPREQARRHHLLADVEEKAGNSLEAVREYQRAAELDPSESNFFDWGAELLLHRAIEPALAVFGKGNHLFPRSARLLVGLGVAWYSNGSYDQASQRLCEASDLNPGDADAYLFLGKIQAVENTQSECSMERLARFAKLQPENALASYYYGVSLWKRRKGPDDAGAKEHAESQLKRALQLDPKLGAGYLQLGILYSEGKDFANAVSSYQKAIQAAPELEEAHYRLSQAYKRTGEKLKAEQELALYNQISKTKDQAVERERRESRQFVYTLRSPQ